ncbi:MAG TPA: proline dehydrogenase family protein [Nitrososphaerales archaeon]|nr:proline dehydrogenase family protein [Nitrososphaerales archaeon]
MGLKERVVLPLAKRWISGVAMDSAIEDAKKANSKGIGAVVNFLGEEIKDPATADAHGSEYLRLQQALADAGINGFVSVKLTQLGLGSDNEGMERRLEKVATNADRLRQLLWLDMESSKFTDATIKTYLAARERHLGMGVALQAYLKRSESDLKTILDAGGKVRIVKGAYRESHDIIYSTKKEVADNFARLMGTLFERSEGFAIGTHDTILVDQAKKLAESSHTNFRFELLKGIRDELKDELVKSGYKVYEYLPYGDSWYAYSKRRIKEHPSNVWLLLRSLV